MIGAASATTLSLMAAASLNALVVWRRLGIRINAALAAGSRNACRRR
jgi:hypothetical protein